jgi:hypothetical protein
MKKWVEQLTRLDLLLKKSLLRRDKNAGLLEQNQETVSKAESTITRYDQVRKTLGEIRTAKVDNGKG